MADMVLRARHGKSQNHDVVHHDNARNDIDHEAQKISGPAVTFKVWQDRGMFLVGTVILGITFVGLSLLAIILVVYVQTVRSGDGYTNVFGSEPSIRRMAIAITARAEGARVWDAVLTLALVLTSIFSFSMHGFMAAKIRAKQSPIYYRRTKSMLIPSALTVALCIFRVAFDKHSTCPEVQLDPDIGGTGVLVGIYSPILLVIASNLAGVRLVSDTGTKELGLTMFANLAYLTFNLIKAQYQEQYLRDLSLADILVALIVIDASNAGVSMTLSNKDVLAARTYVCFCHVLQLISLVTMAVTVFRVPSIWQTSRACCTQQVWWAAWNTCKLRHAHLLPLWIYLFYQFLRWDHRRHLTLMLSPRYDYAKKNTALAFKRRLSTVMDQYLEDVFTVAVNILSLVLVLTRLRLWGAGRWSDWGQSATLTTSFLGFLHWCYVTTPELLRWLNRTIEKKGKQTLGSRTFVFAKRSSVYCQHFYRLLLAQAKVFLLPIEPQKRPLPDVRELTSNLISCAKLGDVKGVVRYLAAGAPIDGEDKEWCTALYNATAAGHRSVVRCLLLRGARLAISVPTTNSVTSSAIHAAIDADNSELLNILLTHLVTKVYRSRAHVKGFLHQRAIQWNSGIIPFRTKRETPLLSAIALGRSKAVAELLLHGASPYDSVEPDVFAYVSHYDRCLPLLRAASQGNFAIFATICAYMDRLDGQAGVGWAFSGVHDFTTALHICARCGTFESCRLLLELNANPNLADEDGYLPLHYAAHRAGEPRILELLAQVSNIDATIPHSGNTALDEAVRYDHIQLVDILLRHGASVVATAAYSSTRLAYDASSLGNVALSLYRTRNLTTESRSSPDSDHDSEDDSKSAHQKQRQIFAALVRAADIRTAPSFDTVSVLLRLSRETLNMLPPQCARRVSFNGQRIPAARLALKQNVGSALWHAKSDPKQNFFDDFENNVHMVHVPRSKPPMRSLDTLDIDIPVSFTKPAGRSPRALHARDLWRFERTFFYGEPWEADRKTFWYEELESLRLATAYSSLIQLRSKTPVGMAGDKKYRERSLFGNRSSRSMTMKQFLDSIQEPYFADVYWREGGDEYDLDEVNEEERDDLRWILAL